MAYPNFSDLPEFTGVYIEELIDSELSENDACIRLSELLPHFHQDDKLLHGYYQIIFYCLDKGYLNTALEFYQDMTRERQEDSDKTPIGDPTSAFIYYCIENKYHSALAFLLSHEVIDKDEPVPLEKIQKTFGIDVSFP